MALTRSAMRGLSKIQEVCDEGDVSDHVRDRSIEIYRQILQESSAQGRSIECVACACVLLAGDELGCPVPTTQACELFGVRENTAFYEKRRLQREFNVGVARVDVSECIESYGESVGVDETVVEKAKQFHNEVRDEFSTTGVSMKGLAAGILYLAAVRSSESTRVTQSEVSHVAGVTEVTLRERYHEVRELV